MKLGIAGSGKIVQEALPVLAEQGVSLGGIWSRSGGERVRELGERYQIRQVYGTYEELLRDPDIDTIYVAVPNSFHFEYARRALEQGKNVICEKPFTTNLKEARQLFDLAGEKGLFLLEAITNQYLPLFHEIKGILEEGRLGTLKLVSLNYSQYSSRYEAFLRGEIHPVFDPACAGGALMDINIYNLHFAVGLFGKPLRLTYRANVERGIDTSGVLTLEYPDFLCVCIGAKDCACQSFGELQGTEGILSLTTPSSICGGYRLCDRKGTLLAERDGGPEHRMAAEFRAFENMIDGGEWEAVEKQREHTLAVMELVEEAGKQVLQ